MTYPTLLSPWYVVQQYSVKKSDVDTLTVLTEYWTTDGEGKDSWSDNPHAAMIFMTLSAAARVSDAEVAEVRVIYSKEGLEQFRPRQFDEKD